MDETKSYITIDAHGVRRVAGTPISMDSVVFGFQQGQSPEEIQRNFPDLSLEQVYGTITHYLSHRREVDEYLRHQHEAWDQSRHENEMQPSAAIERIRKARADLAGHTR